MAEKIVNYDIGGAELLEHKWFNHLDDKDVIKREIKSGETHSVIVRKNDVSIFGAFISIYLHSVHIREVGGRFPKNIELLEIYCKALAKFKKVNKLTVCAKRKGVENIAEKMDFIFDDTSNHFEKVI